MVEFNSELPKGRPQLDPDYWKQINNKDNQNPNAIFDINTNIHIKNIIIIRNFKIFKVIVEYLLFFFLAKM